MIKISCSYNLFALYALQEFSRIKDLLSEIAEQIPITKPIQKTFWDTVIYCTFNALVKGYITLQNLNFPYIAAFLFLYHYIYVKLRIKFHRIKH